MFTDSCNSHMMLIASIQYLQLFFFLVSSYQLIQRKKDPNWGNTQWFRALHITFEQGEIAG